MYRKTKIQHHFFMAHGNPKERQKNIDKKANNHYHRHPINFKEKQQYFIDTQFFLIPLTGDIIAKFQIVFYDYSKKQKNKSPTT